MTKCQPSQVSSPCSTVNVRTSATELKTGFTSTASTETCDASGPSAATALGELVGDERAAVEALGVEEHDERESAPQVGHPQGLAVLVEQAELRCRLR